MSSTITKTTGDVVKRTALSDIYADLEKIKDRQESDSRYFSQRIDTLCQRIDTRMDNLDRKIDNQIGQINQRLDTIVQMLIEISKQRS